jgi:hypothetical protein
VRAKRCRRNGGNTPSFQRRQLEGLVSEAGFKVEAVFGDYKKQKFGANTDRLIILAKAKQ